MLTDAIEYDENHIWINTASEGPLLKCAHEALETAVHWKSHPHLLDDQFARVPVELKYSLGKLIHVNPVDIILGTSASYGLFILANSFPWREGDEVLLMENDFPTNILPWLALEEKGVRVKQLSYQGAVLTADELKQEITPRTKWVCISHIHSFTGHCLDVEAMAAITRKVGARIVVNIAQSAGSRPVDVSAWGVDAVVGVGYKWLCGPYGTGFAWIDPNVRKQLKYNHPYWPAYLSDTQLQAWGPIEYKRLSNARTFDIFGTANFFNFVPLKAAVDFWLEQGVEQVYAYNNSLVDQFLTNLDRNKYKVISPDLPEERTHLIVLSCKDSSQNKDLFQKLVEGGVHPAYWKNNVRFSPHAFNTPDQIDKIIELL